MATAVKKLTELINFASKTPINDNLNRLTALIEARLGLIDQKSIEFDEVIDAITSVGLDRVNETLTPLIVSTIDHIRNITSLFQTTSDTSVTIGTGEQTFTIAEADRNQFVALDYLVTEAVADPACHMFGTFVSLDRDTGELVLNATNLRGAGTFDDWTIKVSAPLDAAHAIRTDNPHATTAAQVGAYTTAQTDTAIAAEASARTSAIATAIANLVASAPATLDTLNELAAALGSDAAFSTTVTTALGNRLRFDAAQSLSAGQKTQAKANIALAESGVLFDAAQSLTNDQKAQARVNITGAPIQAMGALNLFYNAGFAVDQQRVNVGVSIAGTGARVAWTMADGSKIMIRGTMVVDATTFAVNGPPGILNFIGITPTTAQASLGASDEVSVNIRIEGLRCKRLKFGAAGAVALALGFWTAHHRAGAYTGSILNSARTRAYPFAYTQAVADSWEYHTILIPGDATGTWLTAANTLGFTANFAMAAGSGLVAGTPNAWAAADYVGVNTQINGVAATSDFFRITGVTLLPLLSGVTIADLPDAASSLFLMPTFDDALRASQRFFWKSTNYSQVLSYAAAPGNVGCILYRAQGGGASQSPTVHVRFPVEMAAAPTITFYNPITTNNALWRNEAIAVDSGVAVGERIGTSGFTVYNVQTASDLTGHPFTIHAQADIRL